MENSKNNIEKTSNDRRNDFQNSLKNDHEKVTKVTQALFLKIL